LRKEFLFHPKYPTYFMADRRVPLDKAVPKLHECEVLLEYALAQGKKIPNELLRTIQAQKKTIIAADEAGQNPSRVADNTALGSVYSELVKAIAPASPSAVMLMDASKRSWFRFLGPIPLVRKMMIVTIISLAVFLGLFLSPYVDSKTINDDILSFADPMKFLLNELVIVAIAALGASFYGLFEAYKFISNTSFDEKYESIYWIRFVLGIVSGVILAQFIFISGLSPDAANMVVSTASDGNIAKAPVSAVDFITYKPLLAFLGGFSARVVHKILNSLVDSVETFVSGSARDAIRAREEAAKVAIDEKVNAIRRESTNRDTANRLQSTLQLMELQQKLATGQMNTEQAQKQLENMINQLVASLAGQTGGLPVPPPVSGNQGFPPVEQPVEPVTTTENTEHTPSDPFGGSSPVTPNDVINNEELNFDSDLDQK
jgi:hypothetical protein